MLFSRELVNRIGMLDEQFGSGNFEDDDYCLRAALEGYTNLIAGDVFIHHVGSATFDGNLIDYHKALLANQSIFNKKWGRPLASPAEARKIIRLKILEKADELNCKGETDAAIEALLKEGISQVSDEAEFYLKMAEIFLEAQMASDALDVLREAPQSDAGVPLLTCKAMLALGQLSNAHYQLENFIACCGETWEFLELRGNLYLAEEKQAQAAEVFERAIKLNPASASAYSGLARLAESAGDIALALVLFERAFMFSPADAHIRGEYLRVAVTEGELERAEQQLAVARHFRPSDLLLAYSHIDILLKQENFQGAMAVIEHILAVSDIKDGFLEAALSVRSRIGQMQIAPEKHRLGVSVSLCMIMKNEEKNLARCLASVKPLVDEIVIADTGSTDRSREIAEVFGAALQNTSWTGDYSAARNAALEQAKGNWILVMDADEIISSKDHDRFRSLVKETAGKQQAAYVIVTRNYTSKMDVENWQPNRGEYPREEAGRGWMPSDKVRLFPNRQDIRFENPIHEMVEPSLLRLGIPNLQTDIVVHHYGYLDDVRQQNKKELYYELGRKKMVESGESPTAICELAIQASGIGRYDEAIELWQRALAIDPESYLAHFNIGYAYLKKGLFREGSEASRKAMKLRENYREAIINHSICELCLGNDTYAFSLIEKALSVNSDYPTFMLMRAVIHACRGDETAAAIDFMELLEQKIEYSEFINEIAKKLLEGEQNEAACRLVQQALRSGVCLEETQNLLNCLSQ